MTPTGHLYRESLHLCIFELRCLGSTHISSAPADSSFLISDFEPQQAGAEVGTEDEFDPIPVTGRKNSQGESLTCLWLTEGSG